MFTLKLYLWRGRCPIHIVRRQKNQACLSNPKMLPGCTQITEVFRHTLQLLTHDGPSPRPVFPPQARHILSITALAWLFCLSPLLSPLCFLLCCVCRSHSGNKKPQLSDAQFLFLVVPIQNTTQQSTINNSNAAHLRAAILRNGSKTSCDSSALPPPPPLPRSRLSSSLVVLSRSIS